MNATSTDPAAALLANLPELLPEIEAVYKDVHAHPELSIAETRTAELAAKHLEACGFDVTSGIGGTDVVGLLRNGDGFTVMLRADMDALPIRERRGSITRARTRRRTAKATWYPSGTCAGTTCTWPG